MRPYCVLIDSDMEGRECHSQAGLFSLWKSMFFLVSKFCFFPCLNFPVYSSFSSGQLPSKDTSSMFWLVCFLVEARKFSRACLFISI